jgi:hypothetical protein
VGGRRVGGLAAAFTHVDGGDRAGSGRPAELPRVDVDDEHDHVDDLDDTDGPSATTRPGHG